MKEKYIVLNYHNFISLPTEDDKKPIALEAGELNSLKAYRKTLSIDQIRYINVMCDVFKTGRLEFLEEDIEELFEALEIDESRVLTAEEILDIVKTPTKKKLDKIVEIRNLNTIDLFRGIVISMRNLGNEDVSNRVLSVVNKRRDEIYRDPTKETAITIKKTNGEVQLEKQKAKEDELLERVRSEYDAEIAKLQAKVKKLETASKNKTDKKTKEQKSEDK